MILELEEVSGVSLKARKRMLSFQAASDDIRIEGLTDLDLSDHHEDPHIDIHSDQSFSLNDLDSVFNPDKSAVTADYFLPNGNHSINHSVSMSVVDPDLARRESDLKNLLSQLGLLFLGKDYSLSLTRSTCGARISEFINACNAHQLTVANREQELLQAADSLAIEQEILRNDLANVQGKYQDALDQLELGNSNTDQIRELEQLRDEAMTYESTISNLKTSHTEQIASLEDRIHQLSKESAEYDSLISTLKTSHQSQLEDMENQLDGMRSSLTSLESTLSTQKSSSNQEILRLEAEISTRDTQFRLEASKKDQELASLRQKVISLESEKESLESSSGQYIESLKSQLEACKREIQDYGESAPAKICENGSELENLREQYPYQFLLYRKECEKEFQQELTRQLEHQKSRIVREMEDSHSRAILQLNQRHESRCENYIKQWEKDAKSKLEGLEADFSEKQRLLKAGHQREMEEMTKMYQLQLAQLSEFSEASIEKLKAESAELRSRLDSNTYDASRIEESERVTSQKLARLRQKYVETLEKIRADVKEMRSRQEARLRTEIERRTRAERELQRLRS